MTKSSNCEEESPLEITAFKKEVAKTGLSADSSISIRFYYVGGKMVRKIVLHLSSLQTCRPNITRSSAIAKGPRDASCQLKSCQLPRNSAETT